MERRSHPSQSQIESLLQFLEQQPRLAKGFSKIASAKEYANQEWSKLALRLNSMGGGCVKSPKQWIKYWNDKKSAVKKKAASRNAQRHQTGGGSAEIVHLTEFEERIVALMGGEGFFEGDSSLRFDPFPLSSSTQTTDSLPIFTPPDRIATESNTPNIAENNSVIIQQMHIDDFNIMENTVQSFANPVQTSPSGSRSQAVPDQQQPPSQGSTPSRRLHGRERQESQVRRRLFLQRSPPSQRQSNLMSVANKFLRLEERRLDLKGK